MSHPLIDATELNELLRTETPPRVLDVRWRLDRPDGLPAYLEGHVPSAVYVNLDDDLAQHGEAADGRHPLPDAAHVQAAARRLGINDADTVVVYDDAKSWAAARAWWVLTDAGISDVRILDGGLRAWTASGLELETGQKEVSPGSVSLR